MPRPAARRARALAARPEGAPVRALGYLRVSTGEQFDSGAGLAAQETAIRAEAMRRGWDLEVVTEGAASAGSMRGRPVLAEALQRLADGGADVLLAQKLDRVSRSLLDFAEIMRRAKDEGWNLVALDLGIDLSTPAGEFLASVMAAAGQWERRLISQRTRDALSERRAAGVRLGAPTTVAPEVLARIDGERAAGRSIAAITASLNEDGVAAARGGRWHPGTVQHVCRRAHR